MEDNDAELYLKKRARRRLVGAIFFVSVVAVILPVVMDHEPRQSVQDVEIRIPGQDERPFNPKLVAAPAEKLPEKPLEAAVSQEEVHPAPAVSKPEVVPSVKPNTRVLEQVKGSSPAEKPIEKATPKIVDKPAKSEKKVDKPTIKPVEQAVDKPKAEDAKRAAAILSGQVPDNRTAVAKGGEYLVLIGAFSNEANVRSLKAKLSELGVRSFTEPLNTPQGKKTRVRAGPFTDREAAEKALGKMKRIGIAGVVTAKP